MPFASCASIGNPSAIWIAGASTSFSESVPYSASMTSNPPGVPGVTAASGPYSGGYCSFFEGENSGVAPAGATPRALMPMTFFVCGLYISACVSPPQLSVSHIVQVAASIEHAASTALPPFWNIIAPAVAASGLPVMAIQCAPCSGGFCVRCADAGVTATAVRTTSTAVRMCMAGS